MYDKTFGINAPTMEEHLSRNIIDFEDYLNAAHPSTFEELGYPKYQIHLGNETFDLPIVKQIVDGNPRLVVQRSENLSKAIADADAAIESQVKYQVIKDAFFNQVQNLLANKFPNRNLELG